MWAKKKIQEKRPLSQQMLILDRKINTLIPKKVANYKFQKFKVKKLQISLTFLLKIFHLKVFRYWEKESIILKIAAINTTELNTFSIIQRVISSCGLEMLRKNSRLRFTVISRRENITQQAIIWKQSPEIPGAYFLIKQIHIFSPHSQAI